MLSAEVLLAKQVEVIKEYQQGETVCRQVMSYEEQALPFISQVEQAGLEQRTLLEVQGFLERGGQVAEPQAPFDGTERGQIVLAEHTIIPLRRFAALGPFVILPLEPEAKGIMAGAGVEARYSS